MTNRAFGDRLKEAYGNIKNTEIAEKLGVTPSAVQNYVKGRVPDGDTLQRIAKQTNCDLHWLITGENAQNVERSVATASNPIKSLFDQEGLVDLVREIVREEMRAVPVQDLGSIDEFDLDAAMERHPHEIMPVIEEWVAHEGWELPKDFHGMLANTGYSEMTEERRKAMIRDWKMILDRDRVKANKK